MKYFKHVLIIIGSVVLMTSPVLSGVTNKLNVTQQRYVNLSVPVGTTPKGQIFVLNSDSTKQIAYWTTVANTFPGIAPPYPYLNLALDPNQNTTFNLIVPVPTTTSTTGYIGCSLTFDKNGVAQQTAANSCPGLVPTPNSADSKVSVYTLGSNFGNSVKIDPSVLNPQVASSAVKRTITFINKSTNDVCLVDQLKDNPNGAPTPSQMCSEQYQTLVPSGQSVDFPVPVSGLNSAAWIIAGYRAKGTAQWLQTGFVGLQRYQAATKVELTMFPYYKDGVNSGPIVNSVGPTNIDISSVDGINLTFKFYPIATEPGVTAICTLADNNVTPAVQYTGVYSTTFPISYFKNASGNGKFSCPVGTGYDCGCASPCTMAHNNNAGTTVIAQTCCIGDYGTKDSCVASTNPNNPAHSAFTSLIHQQFVNSYGFAYDDAKADFTCDSFASYVFEINGVGKEIVQ